MDMENKTLKKYLEITKIQDKKECLKKQIEKIIEKENLKVELIEYKDSLVLQKTCYEFGYNFCSSILFDFSARYIEVDFPVFENMIEKAEKEFKKYKYNLEKIHNHFEVKHLHFKKKFVENIDLDVEELKFLLYIFL